VAARAELQTAKPKLGQALRRQIPEAAAAIAEMAAAFLHQFAQLTITAELVTGVQQQLHIELRLQQLREEGVNHRKDCEIATRESQNNGSVITFRWFAPRCRGCSDDRFHA
jgi:hypothetical protein